MKKVPQIMIFHHRIHQNKKFKILPKTTSKPMYSTFMKSHLKNQTDDKSKYIISSYVLNKRTINIF